MAKEFKPASGRSFPIKEKKTHVDFNISDSDKEKLIDKIANDEEIRNWIMISNVEKIRNGEYSGNIFEEKAIKKASAMSKERFHFEKGIDDVGSQMRLIFYEAVKRIKSEHKYSKYEFNDSFFSEIIKNVRKNSKIMNIIATNERNTRKKIYQDEDDLHNNAVMVSHLCRQEIEKIFPCNDRKFIYDLSERIQKTIKSDLHDSAKRR